MWNDIRRDTDLALFMMLSSFLPASEQSCCHLSNGHRDALVLGACDTGMPDRATSSQRNDVLGVQLVSLALHIRTMLFVDQLTALVVLDQRIQDPLGDNEIVVNYFSGVNV